MPLIILIILCLLLALGPSFWVRRVLSANKEQRADLAGTGGELAAHLLSRFEISDVRLELSKTGDHYDSEAKAIRLTESVMNEKSLTSVATAAHEFGHALQHQQRYKPLHIRTFLAKNAVVLQRIAAAAIFAIPILSVIPGMAMVARILLLVILASMFLVVVIHFITLPVEFDASFNRALPILRDGDYVAAADLATVRKILLACALTYVSQALIGVLNLGRWLRLLRR